MKNILQLLLNTENIQLAYITALSQNNLKAILYIKKIIDADKIPTEIFIQLIKNNIDCEESLELIEFIADDNESIRLPFKEFKELELFEVLNYYKKIHEGKKENSKIFVSLNNLEDYKNSTEEERKMFHYSTNYIDIKKEALENKDWDICFQLNVFSENEEYANFLKSKISKEFDDLTLVKIFKLSNVLVDNTDVGYFEILNEEGKLIKNYIYYNISQKKYLLFLYLSNIPIIIPI